MGFRSRTDPIAVGLGIVFDHASNGGIIDVQHGWLAMWDSDPTVERSKTQMLFRRRWGQVRRHVRYLAYRQPDLNLALVGVANDLAKKVAGRGVGFLLRLDLGEFRRTEVPILRKTLPADLYTLRGSAVPSPGAVARTPWDR